MGRVAEPGHEPRPGEDQYPADELHGATRRSTLPRSIDHVKRVPRDRSRIYVDFNEMLDSNLVLLSQGDTKPDSSGTEVRLSEGQPVHIYSDDVGPDDPILIADGTVERNSDKGWSAHVKWCCRIDAAGIREEGRDS